jgi:hypothetical protein
MDMNSFQSCIDACNACANACDNCAAMCLKEEHVAAMAKCIALDMDCAQACRFAVSLMARGSEHAAAACRLCAEICTACAQECGQHQMGHCLQCAEACRQCAAMCQRMAA